MDVRPLTLGGYPELHPLDPPDARPDAVVTPPLDGALERVLLAVAGGAELVRGGAVDLLTFRPDRRRGHQPVPIEVGDLLAHRGLIRWETGGGQTWAEVTPAGVGRAEHLLVTALLARGPAV